MKSWNVLGVVLILAASFASPVMAKEKNSPATKDKGAFYSGGFTREGSAITLSGSSKSVAGPPMSDVVVVVKEGGFNSGGGTKC